MEIPVELLTAAVTVLLSVPATYLAMRTKIRRDLEAQYDKDLRERRMTAYTALWVRTEPLARYSPPKALTPDDARSLSKRLRIWYFREGIVLSAKARDAYFALQKLLTEGPGATASARTEPLGEEALKDLQDASRKMHTALCGDVASRRPPMIGSHDRKLPSLKALLRGGRNAERRHGQAIEMDREARRAAEGR